MDACIEIIPSEAGSPRRMMVLTIFKCNKLGGIWLVIQTLREVRWAGGGLAGTKRPQVEEQKVADPDTVTAADSAKHDLHKQGSSD